MPYVATDFSLPPAFRPEPGDIIEGTIDRVEAITGGEYGGYFALVLKLDGERAVRVSQGGEISVERVSAVAVHAFHSVLKNELARVDAQVGDKIGLLYSGEVKGGRGNTYQRWSVRKEGGVQPTISWDREPGAPVASIPASDVPPDTSGLIAPLPHEKRLDQLAEAKDQLGIADATVVEGDDQEKLPF